MLPFAVILHLCIGIYMYGAPLIFPQTSSDIIVVFTNSTVGSTMSAYISQDQPNSIETRAFNIKYLLVILLIVVAFMVLDLGVVKILKAVWRFLCGKAKKIEPEEDHTLKFS